MSRPFDQRRKCDHDRPMLGTLPGTTSAFLSEVSDEDVVRAAGAGRGGRH